MLSGALILEIDGIEYSFNFNEVEEAIVTIENVATSLRSLYIRKLDCPEAKMNLLKRANEVRGLLKSRTEKPDHREIKRIMNEASL